MGVPELANLTSPQVSHTWSNAVLGVGVSQEEEAWGGGAKRSPREQLVAASSALQKLMLQLQLKSISSPSQALPS